MLSVHLHFNDEHFYCFTLRDSYTNIISTPRHTYSSTQLVCACYYYTVYQCITAVSVKGCQKKYEQYSYSSRRNTYTCFVFYAIMFELKFLYQCTKCFSKLQFVSSTIYEYHTVHLSP